MRRPPDLAILSQDGSKIAGMIGPAETEMMPAEGTVDGNKVTVLTRPRTGRTAAFAKAELTATTEKMTGTITLTRGPLSSSGSSGQSRISQPSNQPILAAFRSLPASTQSESVQFTPEPQVPTATPCCPSSARESFIHIPSDAWTTAITRSCWLK